MAVMAVGFMVLGWEVVGYGDDGVSLPPDTLWVFFTDRQLIFRASFQPHGHLGRQAADHEGELGCLGEAVTRSSQPASDSGVGDREPENSWAVHPPSASLG